MLVFRFTPHILLRRVAVPLALSTIVLLFPFTAFLSAYGPFDSRVLSSCFVSGIVSGASEREDRLTAIKSVASELIYVCKL